jgi:hypothetical protein
MATINVKDAAGATVALEKPLTPGQATMANSRPVVLASDQASVPVAATLTAETTKNIGTIRVGDGTSTAAVKAASTAPVATDQALVVAISPNTQNANGQATMANSTPVVMASDFTGASGFMKKEDVASADGDAGVGMLAVQKATPANTAGTDGDYEFLQIYAGRLWASAKIDTAIPAGTNTMGQVGLVPVTSGGLTISSTLIASGTNATSVKASAGQLYKIEITNNSANIGYLKIYNTAGTPTAGSGTPVIRLMCPASASGAGAVSTYDNGVAFATGIGFTFTGGIADADTTSVAASAFIVNLYYK